MTEQQDPRGRFRHLPEPVRPDELVETQDAEPPVHVDREPVPAWRATHLGGPLP